MYDRRAHLQALVVTVATLAGAVLILAISSCQQQARPADLREDKSNGQRTASLSRLADQPRSGGPAIPHSPASARPGHRPRAGLFWLCGRSVFGVRVVCAAGFPFLPATSLGDSNKQLTDTGLEPIRQNLSERPCVRGASSVNLIRPPGPRRPWERL